MNSIKARLILIYAAVVLVVMIVSGTFMLISVRNMEIDRTHDQLRSHAGAINDFIVQEYHRDQFWDAQWGLLRQNEYDIQSMILNDIGRPIAPEIVVRQGVSFNDRAVISAVAGTEYFTASSTGPDFNGNEQQWLSFAMPVESNGEIFIIYTRMNAGFMNESLARLALTLVLMVLISLVITMVMWFFLANTITNPILAITGHAKALADGDLEREIEITGSDEIGQLAYNFNHMAKELRGTLTKMASEKNKSEAILQNTSHGVLAFDVNGTLIHANNASAELMPTLNIEAINLQDTLKLLGFDPTEIYNLETNEVREATYKDEEYFVLAVVTPYTSQPGRIEGFVIVLQDITHQTKLDNMRKEFVANVSHELRTPLTSIRTYSETLLDGALDDPEMATKFLKVIDDEAQRMTLLVTDLLELSRIDSSQAALEMDVVDLVALLRLTVRQSQFLADQKGQVIQVDHLPSTCFIVANASRITQVISNILSNSSKYSPENTVIHVSMDTTEKYYRVYIKDQGMGIPSDSLGRIFERFYRVDKARARAMGGTGLGLAIVKEIMEEHGGRVYASSQFGEGTTMTLRFNKFTGEV